MTCEMFKNHGWRKQYIDKKLSIEFVLRTINYCNTDILSTKLQEDYAKLNCNVELSEDVLYSLGLSRVKSRFYFFIIKDLINWSYTNDQLLEIIAEYATGKYDTNIDPKKLFLYNEKVVNVWYGIDNKNVQCINVKNHTDVFSHLEHAIGKSKAYFHATSWENHLKIMKKGINHRVGRRCLDFGIFPSFYIIAVPHKRVKYQLVSKTDKSDRYFTVHHFATIFFKMAT